MDPNHYTERVLSEDIAIPGSRSKRGYAVLRTYDDGRTVTIYWERGNDTPVQYVPGTDDEQAKRFKEDQQRATTQARSQQSTLNSASPSEQFILTPDPNNPGQVITTPNPNYVQPRTPGAMTDYERSQIGRQQTQDELAASREARAATAQEESNAIAQRQQTLREREANKPEVVNAPETRRTLSVYNPETGQYEARPNPAYDEALANAQQEKERLATLIQLNKLSADQAAQQYQQWFDRNIKIPQAQSQEARARAEEIRMAQEAEDRRQQFAANYDRQRQETALQAGQSAVNQNLQLLPYSVGPKFGGQMSEAINSLARGSSAGVNFTGDAFNFKAPDIEGIAQRATARALSQISPYAQAIGAGGQRSLPVADYSGISFGTEPPPESAPQIDFTPYINSALGGGGGGGEAAAPAEQASPDYGYEGGGE